MAWRIDNTEMKVFRVDGVEMSKARIDGNLVFEKITELHLITGMNPNTTYLSDKVEYSVDNGTFKDNNYMYYNYWYTLKTAYGDDSRPYYYFEGDIKLCFANGTTTSSDIDITGYNTLTLEYSFCDTAGQVFDDGSYCILGIETSANSSSYFDAYTHLYEGVNKTITLNVSSLSGTITGIRFSTIMSYDRERYFKIHNLFLSK